MRLRMKPIFRFALPLALAASLAACGKSPETLFADAKSHFAAQDFRAARLELASALQEDPGNIEMLSLLVETHLRLADPDGAADALARLQSKGGKGPDVQRFVAELALIKQQPQQALDALGTDSSAKAARIRAGAWLALGDDGKAVAAFEQGMAAGGDIRLASDYARYRLTSGDLAGAGAVLTKMRAIDGDAFETLVLAGDLAAAQGQPDKAIAAFKAVLDKYPGHIAPMLALANQYDAKGDIKKAVAVVEEAGKLARDDQQVLALRMQLHSEQGEWENIRQALQGKEGDLDPASGLSMTYAEALLRLGHAEQARVLFNRAALLRPGNPYARLMLGEAQLASGDAATSWQTLQPLAASVLARPEVLQVAAKAAETAGAPEAASLRMRLEPARLKVSTALVERAQAALQRQDWPQVLSAYGKLLEQGDDAEVLKRMALAASRMGQGAAAIGYADRAVALSPENPDYLYTAGLARLEAGTDIAGARRYLELAASVDPRNETIARDLKKATAAAS